MTGTPVTDAPQRRRGRALEKAIFEGVLEQLRTVGYGGLTMDGVAAAAHTGKSSLYRRWSDKEGLIADALRDALPPAPTAPRSGDLRADLLAELTYMRDAFASAYGTAFQTVAAEAGRVGLVRDLVNTRVIDPCVERIRELLLVSPETGEGVASELVARSGPALITHHCVTEGGPTMSDDGLVRVVDEVVLPLVRSGGKRTA